MPRRLLKNTVVQWIGSALSKAIGLAFTLVITRGLGAEQYGKYSLVFTFLSFFNLLASFGIHTIAVREIARKPEDSGRILGDLIMLSAALALASGLLCVAVSSLFGYPLDVAMGIKVAALSLLIGPALSPRVYFEATLRMTHAVVGNLLRDAALLAFAVYLANRGAGFMPYVWASMLSAVFTAGYLWLAGHRLVRPSFGFDRARIKDWLRASLPLGLSGIALYVYNYIDTIMLSKLATMTMVGYYGVAYKFLFLGQLIPGAILVTLFPLFSKYAVSDPPRAQRYLQYTFDTVFMMALFFATMGVLYSWDVIIFLFGPSYAPSYRPLMIFAVDLLFMYPNMLFSKYLISSGRQDKVMMFMVLASALNIVVNFYAIPHFGVIGAALTTMMSELVFFVLSGAQLIRQDRVKIDPVPAFKMLGVAAVMLVLAKISKIVWWAETALMISLFIGVTQWIKAYDYRKLSVLLVRQDDL